MNVIQSSLISNVSLSIKIHCLPEVKTVFQTKVRAGVKNKNR